MTAPKPDALALALAEYQQIKTEQVARINTRDNLIYVTLVAFAGALTITHSAASRGYLLLVPAVAFVLGWTYLANDNMITAIGRYVSEHPALSAMRWETDHPADRRRASRKVIQLAVDLATFCGSGAAALAVFWLSPAPQSPLLTAASAVEAVAVAVLAWEFTAYADVPLRRAVMASLAWAGGGSGALMADGASLLREALCTVTGMVRDPAGMAAQFAGVIAAAGDMLWPPPKGGAARSAGDDAATAVSAGLYLLARCPGGVTFAGEHWCAAPHPDCPGPGAHDGTADAGKGAGVVHTPLWLACAVTAPALDVLAFRPGPLTARRPEEWRIVSSAEILALRVADISCGSGAFLLAALGYLSAALLMAWEAEGDPRAGDETAARRAVAGRCLYGSDISPASVALARLALQLAAYKPGEPVADAGRFAVGDSLLGTDFAAEFPEVTVGGGFDAVIGNPPFLGGQKITGQLGAPYRDRLVREIGRGVKKPAHCCADFLLRAWDLACPSGVVAVIATNTLAQGATREAGLDRGARRGRRDHLVGEVGAVARQPRGDRVLRRRDLEGAGRTGRRGTSPPRLAPGGRRGGGCVSRRTRQLSYWAPPGPAAPEPEPEARRGVLHG